MNPIERPIYLKGHIRFEVGDQPFEFENVSISTYGVMGLPWKSLIPTTHFGILVDAQVRLLGTGTQGGTPDLEFKTSATLVREQSARQGKFDELMGVRFILTPEQKAEIEKRVLDHGFIPPKHARKYPRIPSSKLIQTFPLRALLTHKNSNEQFPLIFDVANLSPQGVLLQTENQSSLVLEPDHEVQVVLEPRGWFPHAVASDGAIAHITDERNPDNGNITRYLGVRFTHIDDTNYSVFMELLKDILERLKNLRA